MNKNILLSTEEIKELSKYAILLYYYLLSKQIKNDFSFKVKRAAKNLRIGTDKITIAKNELIELGAIKNEKPYFIFALNGNLNI
jgi:hypothetical protein